MRHPNLGPSVVDHSATSARSRRATRRRRGAPTANGLLWHIGRAARGAR